MPDRQPFLDPHADHIACGESRRVAREVERVIEVAQYAGDGNHEDG